MADYRRYFVPGGSYFFTLVTYNRQPILTTDMGRFYLRKAFLQVKSLRPFLQCACCLLPDHLRAILGAAVLRR